MSTLNGTDLFLVERGSVNYKITATDVATFVGGGGGGVAAVTGTLPIVIAGTATNPDITINVATTTTVGSIQIATLAEAATGTLATRALTPETGVPKDASGMAGAAIIPGSAAAYVGTPATGMVRYNNSAPPAVIEYYNGSAWVTMGGALAASLAEAAAATITTKYLSPGTGIARDAAGTTGAALLPAGTTAQQPGTPVTGMTRYNSTIGTLEVYNGTTWLALTTTGGNFDPQGWFGHSSEP